MSKKILIIDDSPAQRKLVKVTLESKGYEVLEAENGAQGLELLNPDLKLVVCDVNMPIMDGVEFVEKLKSTGNYQFLPIVMLTTESQTAMKDKLVAQGIRAWITKPFSMDQLLSSVSKLVV
ncbi:response regulator [Leptospira johnsonii]|uniref:Response regulator receiver domain protein n=1 Tax=Leptospira johnsonii TaxID=1917820 RepID=A0A2P2D239_9LEPT|nr:response regulator [Leptospira johnsonii]GBF38729.1 response regulator receiver domain protein [Leptospira johnsonii]